jgi:hypothetical protein
VVTFFAPPESLGEATGEDSAMDVKGLDVEDGVRKLKDEISKNGRIFVFSVAEWRETRENGADTFASEKKKQKKKQSLLCFVACVSWMQSPSSYSGETIDISGLVPDITGLVPTTVSFTNQSETNRYKQQQYLMQNSQYTTQLGLLHTMQPHQSAIIGESQALKTQSAVEISSVEKDQNSVQSEQGIQLHAQQMQHMDTQLTQGSMGAQHTFEQRNLTSTLEQLNQPHQSAFASTIGTQYSVMAQQRADQLAALEQQRKQQMAMLQQHHHSIGMTLTSGTSSHTTMYGGAGSTSPPPSYQSSVYGSSGAGYSPSPGY